MVTSFKVVVAVKRPPIASMIACPIVAEPNKPGFGCAVSSVGAAEIGKTLTMEYVEKDISGTVGSPEAKEINGIGK